MKKMILIGLPVLLLIIVGYRIATHGDVEGAKSIDDYQEKLGIPVTVETVKRSNLSLAKNFNGTIQGQMQADAIANTSEELLALPVKAGDRVRQGQVVAELDTDIASAMSLKYSQTKTALDDAEKDYARMKSLYEAGAISEQAFEKARVQRDIVSKNMDAASKLVKIEAPISGTVTHTFYKIGETVKSGSPVVRIAQLDEILIEISINEAEIAGIANGQTAVVSIAAYPNITFSGKLENLSLSADPATRSFMAWVRVENKELKLRPGMFAKVKLLVTAKENVLTISKDAMIKAESASSVFVVNSNKIAELREIEAGESSGALVEILAGLQEGEQVVVLGQNKLQQGVKVNVVNE